MFFFSDAACLVFFLPSRQRNGSSRPNVLRLYEMSAKIKYGVNLIPSRQYSPCQGRFFFCRFVTETNNK